jgi:hypothetical protein
MSDCVRQSPAGPDNVRLSVSILVLLSWQQSFFFSCSQQLLCNRVQMPLKRTASRRASHDDLPSDDSSRQGDGFLIAPRPRRTTRKTTRRGDASSSRHDEEAANMAEGQAVCQAREKMASDII